VTRYRRWSIRLPSITLAEITQQALTEGWQLSDFVRTLLVMGAAANWLELESEEHEEVLRMRAKLRQQSHKFAKLGPTLRPGRPYASRSIQDTDVIGLILPSWVAHMIESYANVRGLSKNDLCEKLLMEGLMIYMTGEKNLLEATVPADRPPEGATVTET